MLSEKQKLSIEYQNEIIKQYLFDEYKITPAQISRDKNNLPLIIVKIATSPSQSTIECYTLGFNAKKNNLTLYNIGAVKTFESSDSIEIVSLSVHKAFNNSGIGQILMHHVENYATKCHYNTLRLESKKTYTDFSDHQLSDSKLKELSERELVKYLTNNYYDKNLYFYTKLGFKPYEKEDPLNTFTPLKKDRLKQVVLDYGLEEPLKPINKKQYSKSIPKKTSLHPYRYAQDYTYKDYFVYVKNEFVSEQFVPLFLDPNSQGLNLLVDVITKYDKAKFHFPSAKEVSDYYLNTVNRYSSMNHNLNKKYASYINYIDTISKTLRNKNKNLRYNKIVNRVLSNAYHHLEDESEFEQ